MMRSQSGATPAWPSGSSCRCCGRGVLARNEVERNYPYNRRLFKRLSTGHYPLNPDLALRRPGHDGDAWVPAFSALNLALVKQTADPIQVHLIDALLSLPAAGSAMAAD